MGWSIEEFDNALMIDTFAIVRNVGMRDQGASAQRRHKEWKKGALSNEWFRQHEAH